MNDAVRRKFAVARQSVQRSPSFRRGRVIAVTLRGGMMLGIAIVSFSVAYIAGWPELLIVASFCVLAPLLALAVVAHRRPRLQVARFSTPAIVSAGGAGTVRLRAGSALSMPSATRQWSDVLPWSPGRTPWRDVPRIIGGEHVTLTYNFVPPRRGIVELGPLVVRAGDPFGLARGEFEAGGTHRVVVAPELVDLAQGDAQLASHSGSARLFQHHALAGEHDIMTRDYRPGDALGRVHWKASAHHGELMVREDEKRSHAQALIVVDTRRANWRDVGRTPSPDRPDSERFEWALSMTSSLRDYLVRNGLHVKVAETAVGQLADAENVDDFVESLARVRLSYEDGQALKLEERDASGISSIFAILDAPDAETVDALTTQRHGSGFALAFLLGPPREDVVTRFSASGWIAHCVADSESVLAAWHSVTDGDGHD